jgi:hypothetical protein
MKCCHQGFNVFGHCCDAMVGDTVIELKSNSKTLLQSPSALSEMKRERTWRWHGGGTEIRDFCNLLILNCLKISQ